MTVRSVGNASVNLAAHGRMNQAQPDPSINKKTTKNNPPESSAPPAPQQESETPTATGDESTSVPGVLRLLQEGHFKGVADVRLRINFFEELNAMASENIRTAGNEQIDQFFDTIHGRLETIAETFVEDPEALETINEAEQQFQSEAQALIDELNPGLAGVAASGLGEKIGTAFDKLVETLQGLWAPPTDESTIEVQDLIDEPTEDETIPVDEEPPTTPDAPVAEQESPVVEQDSPPAEQESPVPDAINEYNALLTSLRDTFSQSLSLLMENVGSAETLPELSPPPGNGVAYQKFLDIYNAMLAGDQGQTPSEEHIETEA